MLAFIMEVMCSIISRVFPAFGTRSVFTLSDNFIRTINPALGLSYLWFWLKVIGHLTPSVSMTEQSILARIP